MIKERAILEDKLKDVIKEYARSRSVTQQVIKELQNKNIVEGDINKIFQLIIPISSVNDMWLYVFTKALYNATKELKIHPTQYYTRVQIEDGDKWKQPIMAELQPNQPILFDEIIKINNNTWLTVKPIKELYDMFNNHTLVYNVKTQRPIKITQRNGKIIERIDINPKSVHEIESLMTEDLYFPDPITINAAHNESLDMEENDKNNTILISAGSLDLTDGWHRLLSYFKFFANNPESTIRVPITLTRLTEERAKDYIHQKSKHNPLNKEFLKTINPSRLSNQIVDFINTEKQSLLRGRVVKNTVTNTDKNKASIEFNAIADVIELTFAPSEQIQIMKFSKFIMKGLNHIVSVFDNLLKDTVDSKIWCVYICMLYLVKDRENWEELLDELLSNVQVSTITFKAINKIGIRNVVIELKKHIPMHMVDDEGVDNNG